jgi:hypothetical protein
VRLLAGTRAIAKAPTGVETNRSAIEAREHRL